jgi:hypothetical protein
MYLPLIILLIVLAIIFGLIFYFYNKNRAIKNVHSSKIDSLEQAIFLNGNQIKFRNSGLQEYNFLKHNLTEVLVAQPEIIL